MKGGGRSRISSTSIHIFANFSVKKNAILVNIKHWKSRERRNLCGNHAKCGEPNSLSLTETLDPLYLAIILQLAVDVPFVT